MVLVVPLHWYYRPIHLAEVIAAMRIRGAPILRACLDPEPYRDGSGMPVWYAQEGTHRLRAALYLGLAPVLVPVPWRRTLDALVRARHAAQHTGHVFPRVDVVSAVGVASALATL